MFEFLVDPEFLISQPRYNPTWHCIVGRNFGSYVTHETRCVYIQPFSEFDLQALHLLLPWASGSAPVQEWLSGPSKC